MPIWIFQANPKLYDIDSALMELEEIWWRVPQYTAEVHRGDIAVLWRSGPDAGIVGVGRVISEPEQKATPDDEAKYVLESDVSGFETRVLIRVRRTEPIPKAELADIDGFEDHQIIRAPMGSIFPVDQDAYESLKDRLVEPPEMPSGSQSPGIPTPFAWEQRSKSTHPMPGGYDEYLKSLEVLALRIQEERPTRSELPDLVADEFEVSANRSNLLSAFLRKAGFVVDQGETVAVSDPLRRWLESKDDRIPIGLLHSRIRFIGEMLESAIEPKATGEMLEVANDKYECGWSTKAQIDRRRGWLQSAGMLKVDEANRLVTTDKGKALLNELQVYRPEETSSRTSITETPDKHEEVGPKAPTRESGVPGLVDELRESSVESSNPDRFECAVRDSFEWLGFKAEWLGGAGKTDVLLDAPLGLSRSYRVIIDCKTSASGSVGDAQVDWITLSEHKLKHDADFVALVAPAPSGKRMFERAAEQSVTVIAVDELVTLCEQHANAPLDLESYRTLFESGGLVNTDSTAERAEDWLHVVELARLIVDTIELRSEKFGPLDAGGLQLLLADDPVAGSASLEDFQAILDTLAGPLVAVLGGDRESGYRLTSTAAVAKYRLELLGISIFGTRPASNDS